MFMSLYSVSITRNGPTRSCSPCCPDFFSTLVDERGGGCPSSGTAARQETPPPEPVAVPGQLPRAPPSCPFFLARCMTHGRLQPVVPRSRREPGRPANPACLAILSGPGRGWLTWRKMGSTPTMYSLFPSPNRSGRGWGHSFFHLVFVPHLHAGSTARPRSVHARTILVVVVDR